MKDVAVITGGAGGMGLATAKILGRATFVLVADVRVGRLDEALGVLRAEGIDCDAQVCDVTDASSVTDLADHAATLGRVTSVVHTAGLSPQMGSPRDILRVNVAGTVNVTNAFLRLSHDGFGLVNVASSAGHLRGPSLRPLYGATDSSPARVVDRLARACRPLPARLRPGLAYALSKSFVIWYSQARAADFGQHGARIMSVSPGSFDTEMGRLEVKSGSAALAEHSALGRFGRVEEIAEVLAFCSSDRAGYLTGTDLLVDGGASATMTLRHALAMARHAQ